MLCETSEVVRVNIMYNYVVHVVFPALVSDVKLI